MRLKTGLEPHYPNEFCQPEAILLPSMDFMRDESHSNGWLIGKIASAVSSKGINSKDDGKVRVALPVGRKPTLEQTRLFNEIKNINTKLPGIRGIRCYSSIRNNDFN